METIHRYDLLAELFSYPKADFPERVALIREAFSGNYPKAAEEMALFTALLPQTEGTLTSELLDEMQELFTRSFEVQSVTTLDVGYVAFGDDYKRAELLVNLNREHREVGVDCGSELSDHLVNVLKLLARWQDAATMAEFVELILHPCVESMIGEFGPERMEQRNALYKKHYKTLIVTSEVRATLYRHALGALLQVLRQDFGLTKSVRPEETSSFLRSIGREMEIEARGAGHKPSAALQQPGQNNQQHMRPGPQLSIGKRLPARRN